MNREQQAVIEYLREEIRVLREHIPKKRIPFSDEQRCRLARKTRKVDFGKLGEIASLVTPETLLRWHRRFVEAKYDSSSKRIGRPRIKIDLNELIIRLANENRDWGYGSIEGALLHLGHDVSRSTIGRVLKSVGIEPAPNRKKGMTWSEFCVSIGRLWQRRISLPPRFGPHQDWFATTFFLSFDWQHEK